MYMDKILVPAEAIRLAALGGLTGGEMSYEDLAKDIRHVVARVVGPNLDLLGSSLEILRLEGLLKPANNEDQVTDSTLLKITEEGREAFEALMSANLRVPMDETGRLVYFLKLRFLDQLQGESYLDQLDLLVEFHQSELARLEDLNKAMNSSVLSTSLEMDIAYQKGRIEWLMKLEDAA